MCQSFAVKFYVNVRSFHRLFADPDSLFGNVPFDRLADLEADEIDDGSYSSDSQFETEPLDSSSSDGDERSSQLLSSPERLVYRRRHPSSVSDESSLSDVNASDIPNWFCNGPFKYNGRVAMLALPGLILVLLFSGET